ncbi:hypothetical protein RMSM_06590 [Rhodopirellula maiorica SM1]|uniref:Uncharacterized protein n=1 Tax=Rhodopirellula maiorica SM1 TaxID=1265738 RepID=M5RBP7_9BACT|nr:hypothetical protein RMSM_06590 [Rhodopirellula maiorica SM1]
MTMGTLDHELSGNRLSIVHFWATWNNVDKLMDAEVFTRWIDIRKEDDVDLFG